MGARLGGANDHTEGDAADHDSKVRREGQAKGIGYTETLEWVTAGHSVEQ